MRGEAPDNCKALFQADRNQYTELMNRLAPSTLKPYVRDSRGWILFGPQDVRSGKKGWHFALQCRKLTSREARRPDLHVRVRVGCRYYSLKQAWQHWGAPRKRYYCGYSTARRNECKQAVEIIRLMLLQAQAYGLLSLYSYAPKFDSTILKPKRK